jgi:hypothetical protein
MFSKDDIVEAVMWLSQVNKIALGEPAFIKME